MGWISPGSLSDAASALVTSKTALILQHTADDAFGHLADQVDSMRERRARHPLSLSVAVNRIKRELSGQRPAIGAHDMLAAELIRLRELPAFHLDNYMDASSGVSRHWLTAWSATRPRATLARMSSAVAVHTNGLGSLLCAAR